MPSLMTNHLSLESIDQVPETHAWLTVNDHPVSSDPLPTIDISGDEATIAKNLSQACENFGAFQLVGHGVSLELLYRFEAELLRLFSLPSEQKMKAARPENGVSGYGMVPIANFFEKVMWSEGFTFAGSPLEHAQKLWPEDPMQFCNVMEEYDNVMKNLAVKLIRLMLLSLGLNDHDIKSNTLLPPSILTGAVRLNSYPACPDPHRAMGMAAHSDSSLITILYQNSTTGLQVLRPKDESGPDRWSTFPAVRGSLIVILGDLFHIVSDGRFKSGYHRAVVNRTDRRLSSAYFCGPATAKVGPVEKIVDPKLGPRFRSVSWPEYRDIKGKLFQEAIDLLKM